MVVFDGPAILETPDSIAVKVQRSALGYWNQAAWIAPYRAFGHRMDSLLDASAGMIRLLKVWAARNPSDL